MAGAMLAVKQLNARGRLAMPEALEALEAFPGVTGSINFGPLERRANYRHDVDAGRTDPAAEGADFPALT